MTTRKTFTEKRVPRTFTDADRRKAVERLRKQHAKEREPYDDGMSFEHAMRLLFGDRADRIAGSQLDAKSHQRWLTKAIKKFLSEVNALESTVRYQEVMHGQPDSALQTPAQAARTQAEDPASVPGKR